MKADKLFQWTPEAIASFWDHVSAQEGLGEQYFANQLGYAVVNFLSYATPLADRAILDYGCGPGFLIPHLLTRGALVSGTDYSEASVNAVNNAFRDRPNWQEARPVTSNGIPWPNDSFHAVCCLETIEHVLQVDLDVLFEEMFRVLKPGGKVLLTTPNNERLESNMVYCPKCGSEFHRWQHVRSWSAETLSEKLEEHGYEVLFCGGANLTRFRNRSIKLPSWKDMCGREIGRVLSSLLNRLLDRGRPRAFPHGRVFQALVDTGTRPHLVAVGAKSSSSKVVG